MIRVITFGREYGSGAAAIAEKLAKSLDWKLWDRLLTSEIARLLECDPTAVQEREEHIDSLRYRLTRAFLQGSFEGSMNLDSLNIVDADRIQQVSKQVVLAAAKPGHCVIVGRGAPYYLHGCQGAFHVFIYASLEEKVRRLREMGKTESEANNLAKTVDQDRAEFIKKYFGVKWPQRYWFDLMINSKNGDEAVVEMILGAVASLDKRSA